MRTMLAAGPKTRRLSRHQVARGECLLRRESELELRSESGRNFEQQERSPRCRARWLLSANTARPMLEIISRDPDCHIVASAGKLAVLGFSAAP